MEHGMQQQQYDVPAEYMHSGDQAQMYAHPGGFENGKRSLEMGMSTVHAAGNDGMRDKRWRDSREDFITLGALSEAEAQVCFQSYVLILSLARYHFGTFSRVIG